MKKINLQTLNIEQLIAHFVEIGLAQEKVLLHDDSAMFSALFCDMRSVVEELKGRDGDQRRALLSLYEHPNLQVRLKAVKNSLALAPEEGRRVLRSIADSHEHPQALEAGMTLWNLDEGIFKPT